MTISIRKDETDWSILYYLEEDLIMVIADKPRFHYLTDVDRTRVTA